MAENKNEVPFDDDDDELEEEIAVAEAPDPTSEKKKRWKKFWAVFFTILFTAITVLGFVFFPQIYGENAWCKSNPTHIAFVDLLLSFLPDVIGTVQALFVALILNFLLTPLIAKTFYKTRRMVTVGKLIKSILTVVIWAGAGIAILAVWGVDVGALLAGAGIITIIIGLGMQSLIADIVAGVFLVCDGLLEIGDVVIIDGWRGNVLEIGIRNTTLINYSGDIRVCSNSTIKVFTNQSRETSLSITTISVSYNEDIKRIEKIFEENRKRIKKHVPQMTDLPRFIGVDKLNDSGVDLIFGASCKEDDYNDVRRALNKEIKILFDAHGIEIPFPQVVVNEPRKRD